MEGMLQREHRLATGLNQDWECFWGAIESASQRASGMCLSRGYVKSKEKGECFTSDCVLPHHVETKDSMALG